MVRGLVDRKSEEEAGVASPTLTAEPIELPSAGEPQACNSPAEGDGATVDVPGHTATDHKTQAPGSSGSLRTPNIVAVAPSSEPLELFVRNPKRYEIIEEHGRGGLGRVMRAHDKDLDRSVAIKELLRPSRIAEARFVREATITAKLQHPGIVPVHEAGRWPDGTPFYAMKLVEGRPLKELIAECATLEERLALLGHVVAMADAVAYAHAHGVIHRDLKPSNVIVGEFGETVVIDWGLAKFVAESAGEAETVDADPYRRGELQGALTGIGGVVGTPAYMAPEQAAGEQVDARSDVYSLGAILYHVLLGQAPYAEREPAAVIAAVIAGPPAVPERPSLPSDLRAVLAKAMAREPSARYATATEFRNDLSRFQAGRLVEAHHYSPAELARRWMSRHGALLALGVIALLLLTSLGGYSLLRLADEQQSTRDERDRAERALGTARAEKNGLVLLQAERAFDADPTQVFEWLSKYTLGGERRPDVQRLAAAAASKVHARAIPVSEERLFRVGSSRAGPWIAAIGNDAELRVHNLESQRTTDLGVIREDGEFAFSPTRPLIAFGPRQGGVHLYDLEHESPAPPPEDSSDFHARSLAFSQSGELLVAAGAEGVRVWQWTQSGWRIEYSFLEPSESAMFVRGGEAVVVCTRADELRVVDPRGSLRLGRCDVSRGHAYAVSGPGTTIASAFPGGEVRVWIRENDTWAGQALETNLRSGYLVLALSDDGQMLAVGDSLGQVELWDLLSRRVLARVGIGGGVYSVDISADKQQLLLACESGTTYLHEWSGNLTAELRGHVGFVAEAHFAADGVHAFSAGADGTVRRWLLPTSWPRSLGDQNGQAYQPVWITPRELAVDGVHGTVRIWRDEHQIAKIDGHSNAAFGLDLSARGRLATASLDGNVRVWDVSAGQSTVATTHAGVVRDFAWIPSKNPGASVDDALVSAGSDGAVNLWSAGDPRPRTILSSSVAATSVAADESRILIGDDQGRVHMLEVRSAADVRNIGSESLPESVFELSFLSAGRALAVTRAGKVFQWTIGETRPALVHDHDARSMAVAASESGRWFATAAANGELMLFDTASGSKTVYHQRSPARSLAFSGDESLLGVGGTDGSLNVLALASRDLRAAHLHKLAIRGLAFSPDSKRLATAGFDGRVLIWDLASLRTWPEDANALSSQILSQVSATQAQP